VSVSERRLAPRNKVPYFLSGNGIWVCAKGCTRQVRVKNKNMSVQEEIHLYSVN
jgi:hypothetical protein